jgi:hypothetical protein
VSLELAAIFAATVQGTGSTSALDPVIGLRREAAVLLIPWMHEVHPPPEPPSARSDKG